MLTVSALPPAAWIVDDYRMAASLKRGSFTIEALAGMIGAEIESYVEDGLGPAKSFAGITSSGAQIGFDWYAGGSEGPNLLVKFSNGTYNRAEALAVLSFFGVADVDVCWFAPAGNDV